MADVDALGALIADVIAKLPDELRPAALGTVGMLRDPDKRQSAVRRIASAFDEDALLSLTDHILDTLPDPPRERIRVHLAAEVPKTERDRFVRVFDPVVEAWLDLRDAAPAVDLLQPAPAAEPAEAALAKAVRYVLNAWLERIIQLPLEGALALLAGAWALSRAQGASSAPPDPAPSPPSRAPTREPRTPEPKELWRPRVPGQKPDLRLPLPRGQEMVLVHVPPGSFLMGSDDSNGDAWDDEKPQHPLFLEEYYAARLPVTWSQYQLFMQAGGYREARYWPEAQAAGYWRRGMVKDWNDDWHSGPVDDWQHGLEHPVVGVNWYEALAFARWFDAHCRRQRALPQGWAVRLPTEAEWEKAARGADGRIYPWGDDFDPKRCNTYDGGVGGTTPVGRFSPAGDSLYGCTDMAGNVWEWTGSLWGKHWDEPPHFGYPYRPNDGREDLRAGLDVRRVVRGGSWAAPRRLARCASRRGNGPGARADYLGFRVVVALPISQRS